MGPIKVLRVIVCLSRPVGTKLLDVNSRKCQIGGKLWFLIDISHCRKMGTTPETFGYV